MIQHRRKGLFAIAIASVLMYAMLFNTVAVFAMKSTLPIETGETIIHENGAEKTNAEIYTVAPTSVSMPIWTFALNLIFKTIVRTTEAIRLQMK